MIYYRIMDRIASSLLAPFFFPFSLTQRIGFLYLFSSLLIALVLFIFRDNGAGERFTFRRFFSFVFPVSIYGHRSAKLDYFYFVISRVLFFGLLAPVILGSSAVASVLLGLLGKPLPGTSETGLLVKVFYTALFVVAADFGLFISHYIQHKIPVLWEFHKVHHSAEVMTPITVYRMHPLDDFVSLTTVAFFTGLADAAIVLFSGVRPAPLLLWGVNFIFFAYYLFGYNLRHSHIWLSYGPFLSRLFISPAQHQIHHSKDRAHFDKNFGFIFAFWDVFWGTLCVPDKKMDIRLGLSHDEEKEYSSLPRLFFMPFRKAAKLVFHSRA